MKDVKPLKDTEWEVVACLIQDARMKLTDMSRKSGIPISTLFDVMRNFSKNKTLKYAVSPNNMTPNDAERLTSLKARMRKHDD